MFVGVQVAVEGEGWMVYAAGKYYGTFESKLCIPALNPAKVLF